jgi:hypothetical protein
MYEGEEPYGAPGGRFTGVPGVPGGAGGSGVPWAETGDGPPWEQDGVVEADGLRAATRLVGGQWDIDAEFEQLFRQPDPQEPQVPPLPPPLLFDDTVTRQAPVRPAPVPHRKRRPHRLRRLLKAMRMPWTSVVSFLIALATATIACVVSVLGAMVSYDPLKMLAYPTAHHLAPSWPLLVYGPWLAGCLSVLRAAAHQRHVRTAWAVVTAFSAVAVVLCVAHAPRTPTSMATAGLPPVAALACFHLLYRQVTLVQPRHARLPRQRRHRL